jgi:hypothetical protein
MENNPESLQRTPRNLRVKSGVCRDMSAKLVRSEGL